MWNICRTCMTQKENMISIFDQDKSPSISAMIMTISSLEFLPNDRLPSEICITCFETLEMTYYFKQQVTNCNDALQKQVHRTSLLERCRMLAQQQTANKEVTVKREEGKHVEYVRIVDADDVATENIADHPTECRDPLIIDNDTNDLSSKCDVLSIKVELPSNSVTCDDFPEESSSDYIEGNNFYFEGKDCKSEIIDVEEHGVQFEKHCEITPREIISNNVAQDDKFCSLLHETTESYNGFQNVEQDSTEKGKGTSEVSEGSKRLKDVAYLPSGKSFKCTYCNKLFNRENKLKSHMCEETNKKCEICAKIFDSPARLKVHMRTHTGERPYKCQYCNAGFSQKGTLKSHIRVHTGEVIPKPYKCEVCAKTFQMSCSLTVHMRTHTGEKPFKCHYCNAGFSQTGSLKTHIRLHTGEVVPKPYTCEVCGKAFRVTALLKTHMRTHTGERPFPCQYCNAAFSTKFSLQSHTRMHTGEPTPKPHKCDVCGDSFVVPSRLKKHMRKHSSEKKL